MKLRAYADAIGSANPPRRALSAAPASVFSEANNRDASGPLSWGPTLFLIGLAPLSSPATTFYMQMDAGDLSRACTGAAARRPAGPPAACQPALVRAEFAAALETPAGAAFTSTSPSRPAR